MLVAFYLFKMSTAKCRSPKITILPSHSIHVCLTRISYFESRMAFYHSRDLNCRSSPFPSLITLVFSTVGPHLMSTVSVKL